MLVVSLALCFAGIAIYPDNQHLLIADGGRGHIYKLSLSDTSNIVQVDNGNAFQSPSGVVIDQDGTYAYVSDNNQALVFQVDLATGEVSNFVTSPSSSSTGITIDTTFTK